MKNIIDEIFAELYDMSQEELMMIMEEHKDGDVARSLIDMGFFDDHTFGYDQMLLYQEENIALSRKRPKEKRVNIKYKDKIDITANTHQKSFQNPDCSQLESEMLNYTIQYPSISKREHRKRNVSYEITKTSVITFLNDSSSDDYEYEYAA